MSATPLHVQSERVHGHDVMAMMLEAARPFSRDELVAALIERFGPSARFHTCSAQGLTAAQIVEFLDARGKFVQVDGKLTTEPDRICSHGGDHAHG